jgi:hypothetical protein
MESMESHKAGFPPFPHSLEILSGLPHFHGLYDEKRYSEARAKTNPNFKLKPYHRKGLVTDVPGPKCNGCSGTLIPQEGLVTSPGA